MGTRVAAKVSALRVSGSRKILPETLNLERGTSNGILFAGLLSGKEGHI